jgi:phospholipase C
MRRYSAILAAGVLAGGAAVGATVASASTSQTDDTANLAALRDGPASYYKVVAGTRRRSSTCRLSTRTSHSTTTGTYPHAANTDGSPFHARPGTPKVNGLSKHLLKHNPNSYNPERLTHAQALTCDQNHGYLPEQQAFNGGKMDMFVQFTQTDNCTGEYGPPGIVMDYFDGQHGHRAVELRAELRDERQQLQHELRPVHTGRAERHLRQRR